MLYDHIVLNAIIYLCSNKENNTIKNLKHVFLFSTLFFAQIHIINCNILLRVGRQIVFDFQILLGNIRV